MPDAGTDEQPGQGGGRARGIVDRQLAVQNPRVLPDTPTGYHGSDSRHRENPCETVTPTIDLSEGDGAG